MAANSCAGCPTLTPTGPNGHYHATAVVSHVCIGLPGADSDSDGVCNADDCTGNDTDCDDDLVGDRFDNCVHGANPALPNFAQSQRDLSANGSVGVIDDLAAISGAGFTEGGDPSKPPGYAGRYDLNYDGFIDVIGDMSLMVGVAFLDC